MLRIFDKTYNKILLMTEADFSYVTTHDFKGKSNVKSLQNDYILKRIPQRRDSEIIVGFVGNADGLQSHIEEYQQLGFTNLNQIIIFEQQPAAAAALVKKAIELGYKTSPDNQNSNELRIYNSTFHLDLSKNTDLQEVISQITHIDYDGTSAHGSYAGVIQEVFACFSYPNVMSMVNVHAASRTKGGLVTPATDEINAIVNKLLQEPFTYTTFLKEVQEGTLSYFFQRAAQSKETLSTPASTCYGILKDRLKSYIGLRKLNTRPVLASYQYLANAVAEQKDLSCKVIPYSGRTSMYSVVVVRDSSNTAELDASLQGKSNVSTPERLINTLTTTHMLGYIVHKKTNQRLSEFLKTYNY